MGNVPCLTGYLDCAKLTKLQPSDSYYVVCWKSVCGFSPVPDGQYCERIRVLQRSPVSVPGRKGKDSVGVKTQFSFFSAIASKTSVVPMPVLNRDVHLCVLPTSLLVSAVGERGRSFASTL